LPDDDHALRAAHASPLTGAGPKGGPSNLTLRVASAAVLVPLAVASAYWGGWPFVVFWALAAIGILWEWIGLVVKRTGPSLTADGRVWAAGGVVYAAVAFFGPVLLRRDAELGFTALLFLFAVVWATDILAYFTGRAFGGALLWPRVSPKKTWSGALGGVAGAIAAGIAVAAAGGIGNLAAIAVLSLLLSVLSQAGDMFESAVKRHFAAKDASGLIPGHGGVMDRLDGFMVAAFAAAAIGILRQGFDAPAHGLLLW
jgi:phosphatidate cytidylyltransferase